MAVGFRGAGGASGGVGALTATWPGAQQEDDFALLLLEVQSSQSPTSPSGWTEVSGSPIANATYNHKFYLYHKLVGASESSVTVADTGDHQVAQILVFSGVDTTAPIETTATSNPGPATALVGPGVTTTSDGAGVVFIFGLGRDADSTAGVTDWANSNLASITEVADFLSSAGGGGGFAAAWGIKTTAGATGDTTATQAASAVYTAITVALKPAAGGATNTDTAAGSGSIAVTGSDASALRSHLGIAASGSVTITGSAANGARSYLGNAANGSITITGSNADGAYTPVGALTSAADSGSVVISGSSAIGRHDYLAAAGSGSITITGSAANAVKSLGAVADSGSVVLTGSSALGIRTWLASADAGSISITGSSANGVASTTSTGTLDPATIAAIADAVWAHSSAVQIEARLTEAWGRLGLDPANPLISGQTEISFGAIVMAMTGDESQTTVTRQ